MNERSIRVSDSVQISSRQMELWNGVLDRCGGYSFFQTPCWSSILETCLPHAKPMHRWFRFSDGIEAALPLFALPKRLGLWKWESLPWGTYGDLVGDGPIRFEHRLAAAENLLSPFYPLCEISLSPQTSDNLHLSKELGRGISVRETETHILTLSASFEEIWGNCFQSRNRTAIRRARDRGVVVDWSNCADSVRAVRDLYRRAMERWEGVETLPLSFFDGLKNLPGEDVRIWTARCDGRPAACDVVLYGKGEVQYFAGASDPEFSDSNASKLLMSEIVRDACERNYQFINFGASGGLSGVERFKEIFGGKKVKGYRLRFERRWMELVRQFIRF